MKKEQEQEHMSCWSSKHQRVVCLFGVVENYYQDVKLGEVEGNPSLPLAPQIQFRATFSECA
jgi:hypothetical protein